jgi:hypothetical protein
LAIKSSRKQILGKTWREMFMFVSSSWKYRAFAAVIVVCFVPWAFCMNVPPEVYTVSHTPRQWIYSGKAQRLVSLPQMQPPGPWSNWYCVLYSSLSPQSRICLYSLRRIPRPSVLGRGRHRTITLMLTVWYAVFLVSPSLVFSSLPFHLLSFLFLILYFEVKTHAGLSSTALIKTSFPFSFNWCWFLA